jgi:hypothetical protein
MRLLMGRSLLGVKRDPMQSKAKVGQAVFFAIVVAVCFSNLGFMNEGGLDGKVDATASPKKRRA